MTLINRRVYCIDVLFFIEPNIQIIINNKGSIHVIRLLLAQKEDLHVTSQSAAVSHCISFINSFYHPEVKSYQR